MNDMLAWLLVGHMAGDFLFQTRWMAERKTTHLPALIVHSAIYACVVWVTSLASFPGGGLSYLGIFFVFVSHAVIDKRDLTLWWCRNVTRSNLPWLTIATDQALHCVVLALTCLIERSL